MARAARAWAWRQCPAWTVIEQPDAVAVEEDRANAEVEAVREVVESLSDAEGVRADRSAADRLAVGRVAVAVVGRPIYGGFFWINSTGAYPI